MQFLIQSNLLSIGQLKKTEYVMETYDSVDCSIVPFEDRIVTTNPLEGLDYFPYGSTSLTNYSLLKCFNGLHLNLETFCCSAWEKFNSSNMLNRPRIMSAADAVKFLNSEENVGRKFFMRPGHDLKQFSGNVNIGLEFSLDLQSMIDSFEQGYPGTYSMDPKTEIAISDVQEIQAEWRWFIISGQIISGSMYRAHGQLRKIRENDLSVIKEAQTLADYWLPDSCCVMDTCLNSTGDVKIIEFNTINSSGFYDHDSEIIFDALANFHGIEKK